jgi:type II secretory pathway component PulM
VGEGPALMALGTLLFMAVVFFLIIEPFMNEKE